MFSKRIRNVQPSGTVQLANKVKRLKSQGLDILSFTLGEPDFPTPQHIVDAAKQALDEGLTHYTQSLGMLELREAISDHISRRNGIKAGSENIMILPTKFALYSAIQAYVNPGEQVIFPNPGWVSYGPMITLAKGTPVPVKMRYEDGWKWDPEDIRAHITPKTKAIIINTPSNPTGSIMSREILKEIGDLAEEKDLVVISDEVYENLVYEDEHFSIGSLENIFDRVVTISGFSKSYAMTGWRVGWMVAKKETIRMVNKLQQHSLTCLPPFVQMGALAALKCGDQCVIDMRDEFRSRRDLLIPLLNEIPGVSCEVPKGAFYAFFKMDTGFKSMDLAEMLLYKAHVALTPGSAFGSVGDNYMRMSYASSRENLKEGVRRIGEFVNSLKIS
jgi:aspartate aminotransferase